MKIQFIAETPLEVDHYAPVVRECCTRGHETKIIPVLYPSPDPSVQKNHEADFQESLASLKRKNIAFDLEKDTSADIAIVTSIANALKRYKRAIKLKFRYGMATIKENCHYEPIALEGFHGILVHGQLDKKIFSQYFDADWIEPMGMPLFDEFFSNRPDLLRLRQKFNIPSGCRTITYLPSWNWNGHSSILPFKSALENLASRFPLIVKPHPNTELYVEEKEAYSALKMISPKYLLPSSIPVADAIAVSDLVIADAKSGTASEVPLLFPNKPVVLLTPFDRNAFMESISMVGPLVNNPLELASTVDGLMEYDSYEKSRHNYASLAFGDCRGNAAALAVSSILKLYEREKCKSIFAKLTSTVRNIANGSKRSRPLRPPQSQ